MEIMTETERRVFAKMFEHTGLGDATGMTGREIIDAMISGTAKLVESDRKQTTQEDTEEGEE
jgi:hypothetical protein